MQLQGVRGKIAWVNLNTGEVNIEEPGEELYLKYLGGYGLGAYYAVGGTEVPVAETESMASLRKTILADLPHKHGPDVLD